MSKNGIDYGKLENKIYKRAYKLSEVNDQIEKVAFDIVRFKDDDNAANLWQVESSDDGQYIVALYDVEAENVVEAFDWSVDINKIGSSLNFHYKGDPIVSVASSRLGIPETELNVAAGYLPEKLSHNTTLVNALLSELQPTVRQDVLTKYPELN